MSDTILLVEKQDGIATLTLNRPQAMNALSRELRTLMVQTFDELQNDLVLPQIIAMLHDHAVRLRRCTETVVVAFPGRDAEVRLAGECS